MIVNSILQYKTKFIPVKTNNNSITDNVYTNKLSYILTIKFKIKENITITVISYNPH